MGAESREQQATIAAEAAVAVAAAHMFAVLVFIVLLFSRINNSSRDNFQFKAANQKYIKMNEK